MAQENVELVKRLLWDGVDAVPIVRDDAALANWIGPGSRTEVRALSDETRRVWLDFFKPCGKVARAEFYSDRAEALKAAGL